jgi:hypothetical protein
MDITGFLASGLGLVALLAAGWYWGSKIPILSSMSRVFRLLAIFVVWGVATGSIAGLSGLTASSAVPQTDTVGIVDVRLSNGIVNSSVVGADNDYLNDAEDLMTIYVTDSEIADGDEIYFNATIERNVVEKAGAIAIECSIADKEISGVTADNLAQKTNGKVDLDVRLAGESGDQGTHVGNNKVTRILPMAEGTAVATITVAFDQEETYEDGMTPYSSYVDVVCSASGTPFGLKVIASD